MGKSKAQKLVEMHVLHRISLTMEKVLSENPVILFEFENYKEDKETGEYPEVFEWWAVSDWLADRLKEEGEIVGEVLDFCVWGRQTTGQAIYMDPVIQRIAQKYF